MLKKSGSILQLLREMEINTSVFFYILKHGCCENLMFGCFIKGTGLISPLFRFSSSILLSALKKQNQNNLLLYIVPSFLSITNRKAYVACFHNAVLSVHRNVCNNSPCKMHRNKLIIRSTAFYNCFDPDIMKHILNTTIQQTMSNITYFSATDIKQYTLFA